MNVNDTLLAHLKQVQVRLGKAVYQPIIEHIPRTSGAKKRFFGVFCSSPNGTDPRHNRIVNDKIEKA